MRPVRGEDVVGAAAEQQRVHPLHSGDDLLADDLVDERRLPAAEGEPALGVLVRPAGRLRDAVERGEQVDVDESHAMLRNRQSAMPLAFFVSSKSASDCASCMSDNTSTLPKRVAHDGAVSFG